MERVTDFEETYNTDYLGKHFQYGVVRGSDKVFLIVVGQDGSIYGYENKYLKLATFYNEKYKVTVVVASNPYNGENHLDVTMNLLEDLKIFDSDIRCMGVSNGARLLLINAPLMINWHITRKGLEQFRGEQVTMVYGTRDPSYGYVDLLSTIKGNQDTCFKTFEIEGANHNFMGLENEFYQLPELLF